jgi:hypothetical protein
MRDDLRELEDDPGGARPALLIVSSGTRADTVEDGFSAPVLLDSMSLVSSSAGAGGTPTAVLVSPDGRLLSDVAGGRDAVLELAGMAGDAVAPELEVVLAGAASNGNGGVRS